MLIFLILKSYSAYFHPSELLGSRFKFAVFLSWCWLFSIIDESRLYLLFCSWVYLFCLAVFCAHSLSRRRSKLILSFSVRFEKGGTCLWIALREACLLDMDALLPPGYYHPPFPNSHSILFFPREKHPNSGLLPSVREWETDRWYQVSYPEYLLLPFYPFLDK